MTKCGNYALLGFAMMTAVVGILTITTLALDEWVKQGNPNAVLKGKFDTNREWHGGLIGIHNSADVSFISKDPESKLTYKD